MYGDAHLVVQVTHLGYYEAEEEAARVYDRVAISVNGPQAQTNFPVGQYARTGAGEFEGMARTELQRALGVKPMDKSSQFRGVSRKKGKWEAKVRCLTQRRSIQSLSRYCASVASFEKRSAVGPWMSLLELCR